MKASGFAGGYLLGQTMEMRPTALSPLIFDENYLLT